MTHARRGKGQFVVAKLDRLASNVSFISAIMGSGVDFVAVDNSFATCQTLISSRR
jgi:hypothetical protein